MANKINLTNRGAMYLNDILNGRGWTDRRSELTASSSVSLALEPIVDTEPMLPALVENSAVNSQAKAAYDAALKAWDRAVAGEMDLTDKEFQACISAARFFIEKKAVPGDRHFGQLLKELKLAE